MAQSKSNGTVTIRDMQTVEWFVASQGNVQALYVLADNPSVPIRLVRSNGAGVDVFDFMSFAATAPPADVFHVPTQCSTQ